MPETSQGHERLARLLGFEEEDRRFQRNMPTSRTYGKQGKFPTTVNMLLTKCLQAMKDRHWNRIAKVTKYSFEIESPTFALRNVMEAPLLKFKDDVEVRSQCCWRPRNTKRKRSQHYSFGTRLILLRFVKLKCFC